MFSLPLKRGRIQHFCTPMENKNGQHPSTSRIFFHDKKQHNKRQKRQAKNKFSSSPLKWGTNGCNYCSSVENRKSAYIVRLNENFFFFFFCFVFAAITLNGRAPFPVVSKAFKAPCTEVPRPGSASISRHPRSKKRVYRRKRKGGLRGYCRGGCGGGGGGGEGGGRGVGAEGAAR